jgi:hypothetical protein
MQRYLSAKILGCSLNRIIGLIVLAAFFIMSSSCGTLLYPERRGQGKGSIDAGVAVLDGLGLILFVIPGLVAFTVDFATGAIYLPRGQRTSLDLDNIRVVKVKPKNLTRKNVNMIVKTDSGVTEDIDFAKARVYKMNGQGDFVEVAGYNSIPWAVAEK